MNKVTVTRKQMDAIEVCMDNKETLNGTVSFARVKAFGGSCVCINNMTVEQIVLAWHGYAEVGPDFVDFEEAMRALKNGIDTYYHNEYETMRVYAKVAKEHELMHLEVNRVGLLNLVFEGKWSIEREGDKK